jgi:DNA repair ATPase RecN
MSDKKLEQILAKLDQQSAAIEEHGVTMKALLERQKADFGLITGALDRLSEDIRSVDTRVAAVASDVSHARKELAQLRAEHGGYLRSLQEDLEKVADRVGILERV